MIYYIVYYKTNKKIASKLTYWPCCSFHLLLPVKALRRSYYTETKSHSESKSQVGLSVKLFTHTT